MAIPIAIALHVTSACANGLLPPSWNLAATCPARKQGMYGQLKMIIARPSSVPDLARANQSTKIDL
jgi:hypothetical protein